MNPRYALLAACMMHMEGFYSIKSMSFRNRNPGNIEHANGTMQVYPSIQDGFVALVSDIEKNKGHKLCDFIAKYAPPSENNTSTYLSVVSTLTGIAPTEVL
jgi:hypothetical protein